MGFMDSLRSMFIYSGEEELLTKEKEVPNKQKSISFKSKITNVVNEAKVSIQKETSSSRVSRNVVYDALHYLVLSELDINTPYEEARLMYAKFLEDKCVDENFYSERDKKLLSVLANIIKEMRSDPVNTSINRMDVVKELCNSKIFLNVLEVLDLDYGFKCLESSLVNTYVLADGKYNSQLTTATSLIQQKNSFIVKTDVVTFSVLNEIKSLTDKMEESEVVSYITSKLSTGFANYVKTNESLTDRHLSVMLTICNAYKSISSVQQEPLATPINDEVTPIIVKSGVDYVEELKTESNFQLKYSEYASPECAFDADEFTAVLRELDLEYGDNLSPQQLLTRKRIVVRLTMGV